MARRTLDSRNTRKLTKIGRKSIGLTLPIEFIRKLGWRERQKVIVDLKRKRLTIKDWKPEKERVK